MKPRVTVTCLLLTLALINSDTRSSGHELGVATCDIEVSHQDKHTTPQILAALSAIGVGNRVVTTGGGSALNTSQCFGLPGLTEQECMTRCAAPATPDVCPAVERFVTLDLDEVKRRFGLYLDAHPEIATDQTDLIVLDIEHPVQVWQLGTYEDPDDPLRHEMLQNLQRDLILAIKRRIDGVREVLQERGQNQKLSLFNAIVAQPSGLTGPAFQARMRAYQRAGALGMYDELDYLSPNAYQPWGPLDIEPLRYPTLEAFTRLAIASSESLVDRMGTHKPLAPVMSFVVFNPASKNHCDPVLVTDTQRQLSWIQDYPAVRTIVFWSGRTDMVTAPGACIRDGVPIDTSLDIPAYLAQVQPKPAGCVNHPPIADAGPDRIVPCTSATSTPVTLDGSASTDPDGNPLTYSWTGLFPEGGGVATGIHPTVTLPLGASTISLVVDDGTDRSVADTTRITVAVHVDGLQFPLAALAPEGEVTPQPGQAFPAGRTLPLRLELLCDVTKLTDADVAPPRIVSLLRVGEPIEIATIDLDAGAPNDNGTPFRYDDGRWAFNLGTRGLVAGSYTITIEMPDSRRYNGSFVLR